LLWAAINLLSDGVVSVKKFYSISLVIAIAVSILGGFQVNAADERDEFEEKYRITHIDPHDRLQYYLAGGSISRGGIDRIDSKIVLADKYPYWSGNETYEEAFFDDNFLLFINGWVGMGGEVLYIGSVSFKEDSIDIEVSYEGLPEGMNGPTVVTFYTFLFEFNRTLADRDISVTMRGKTTIAPRLAPNIDTADAWVRDSITEAYNKGFIPEELQNNYQSVISRAEFCRMAVKWVKYITGKDIDAILAERDLSRNSEAFSDTNDSDILAAFALGITNGVGDNRFDPDGEFTREQAATMIMNTCKAIGADISDSHPSGFLDMDSVSSWAVDGVKIVFANGIMQGKGGNNFSPKGTFTIQESIVTLNNINFLTLRAGLFSQSP